MSQGNPTAGTPGPCCLTCGNTVRRITVGPGWVHVDADVRHAPLVVEAPDRDDN